MASTQAEVTVRMGGQDHVIRAEGEQAQLDACLKEFTDRLETFKSQSPGIAERRAVILAVLAIADDLLAARRERQVREEKLRRWAESLRARIESTLDTDPA